MSYSSNKLWFTRVRTQTMYRAFVWTVWGAVRTRQTLNIDILCTYVLYSALWSLSIAGTLSMIGTVVQVLCDLSVKVYVHGEIQ